MFGRIWMPLFIAHLSVVPAWMANADSPQFQVCESTSLPSNLPKQNFTNSYHGVLALMSAHHSASDEIAVLGQGGQITGHFSYGPLRTNLHGERIEVLIDNCQGGYRILGSGATDHDGRFNLDLTPEQLPPVGRFAIYQRVVGDNTVAKSTLRVLPRGTHLVVFDLDGTLTTSSTEMVRSVVENILNHGYSPQARSGAQEVTRQIYNTLGYEVVYLSARIYPLTDLTRSWLSNFVPGTIRMAEHLSEVFGNNDAAGEYKAKYMLKLASQGLKIDAGYGDLLSDIYAYKKAGIAPGSIFMLGANGGAEGTVDLGDGYDAHIRQLQSARRVSQPFVR